MFRLSRRLRVLGIQYGYFAVHGHGVRPYTFGRTRSNCFAADMRREAANVHPKTMRALDALTLGDAVRIELQPLTPTRAGRTRIVDRAYVRSVPLRAAHDRLDDQRTRDDTFVRWAALG